MASILDLFNKSDKNRDYTSPDKTPISTGNDIGGEKNIDIEGTYYTDPYKYGTNYSTDVDKQKGKDLTPFSLPPSSGGFPTNGKSGNIDLEGKYYTDPYKFGTKYWLIDNRFRGGIGTVKLPKIDPNYDPGAPGSGGRRDGFYIDPITNLVDQTPFSIGTDSFGSKNIDRGGHYYKDSSYKFGIMYPKAIDKQINNEDPFQITVAGRTMSTAGVRNGALKLAKILPKKTFTRVKNVIDQELSGLRIKHFSSVIDLYGTEIVRITKQSTNLVDDMKVATGGRRGGGLAGLLRSPFNKVKEKVKDVLGFPETAIPTFVVDEGTKLLGPGGRLFTVNRGAEQNTMDHLAKIRKDAAGSIVGRFLKQNGSGTPKQIVRSAVGSVGQAAKGAIRKGLFGRGTTLETNEPNRNDAQGVIYGSADNNGSIIPSKDKPDRRYTATMEQMVQKNATESPLITMGEGGSNNYANWLDQTKSENKFNGNRKYDRIRDYLINPDVVSSVYDGTTMTKGDKKNTQGYRTKFNKKLFEIGKESITYGSYIDTVTVQIGSVRFNNVAITGLSETLSPSWSSFRMVGSPFNSYVYDSIERSVSFTVKLYALNPLQHKENWDTIQKLTNLVYPAAYIGGAGAVTAPVTTITIGDIYVNKYGFIESLSYTADDESTWELGRGSEEIQEYKKLFENYYLKEKDGNFVQFGNTQTLPNSNPDPYSTPAQTIWESVNNLSLVQNYKAPKMIEIQIGFKFIESRNDAGSYGFQDSPATNIPLQPLAGEPTLTSKLLAGGQFGRFTNPTSMESFDKITNSTFNKRPNPGFNAPTTPRLPTGVSRPPGSFT